MPQPAPDANAPAASRQWEEDRPAPAPRQWTDERPRDPRPAYGAPRGPRPGGARPGARPYGARPYSDRGAPRPYIPIRPAVAADPSLGLAEDEELVAGRRPVEEAFVARRESKRLYVVPQRRLALEKLVLHATSLRIPVIEVEGGTLTAIAGFDGHQGIALVVAPRRWASPDEILAVAAGRGEPALVLVLDSLEDPQNVGTLLRTAEASGVHGAVFPTRHQAPLSPSAVKASAGAVEHLALSPVDDLPGTLADLHARGLRIVGADGEAPLTAREADLRGPVAIVVGSEGKGLGPAIRRRCDLLVRIPMHGRIESLNAAVAGSILLYEAAAQRRLADPGPRASSHDEPGPDADPALSEVAPSAVESGPDAPADELAAAAPGGIPTAEPVEVPGEAEPSEADRFSEPEPEPEPSRPEPEAVLPTVAAAPEAPVAELPAKPKAARTRKPKAQPTAGAEADPVAPPAKPKAARTRKPKADATPPTAIEDDDALLPEHPAAEPPEV